MKKSKLLKLNYGVVRVLVTFTFIFGAISLFAQDRRPLEDRFKPQSQSSTDSVPPPNVIVSTKEDYRIGTGDFIEVRVEDAPELLTRTRVNSKGSIFMPYLQYVDVGGKTTEEVTMQVASKLRGKYLKNPHVSVSITQVNSHSFLIQGAVRRPGPFQIEGRPTLFGLIGYAGGLLDNHGSRAYIIRELKELGKEVGVKSEVAQSPTEAGDIPKYEMLVSNISSLYKGKFDQNILLEPGDVVNIPQTDVFFVAGEVNAPGEFPLKDGTTLRQAIALAQNVASKAQPKNTIIFREGTNGERKEINVDVAAIMSNKSPDIPILANDIIIVPNSKLKSAIYPILNAFGSGASLSVGGRVLR
ncbi:MAG: polysaccharide biosynthesis/export family protein [Acidobacteria bacterium]|nr:polysaccharide biosynthesis/export family protein [Acidobacteriota bacterium]